MGCLTGEIMLRFCHSCVVFRIPVEVPTGLADFPGEFLRLPVSWVRDHFRNIVQFTEMPKGGHFAALEEPELLAKDIRSFCHKVQ